MALDTDRAVGQFEGKPGFGQAPEREQLYAAKGETALAAGRGQRHHALPVQRAAVFPGGVQGVGPAIIQHG